MPGSSNGKQFIGPRILTRRQFLRGLGGGAAAFGLGSLEACGSRNESRVQKERRGDQDDDGKLTKREFLGRKGLSYLNRTVTEPVMLDYLESRASTFGEHCGGGEIPSDMEISLNMEDQSPLDAGGIAPNDLRLMSLVDLEGSRLLMDYLSGKLGREVTPENAGGVFSTTRFFAAASTRGAGGLPMVGITDSVSVVVGERSARGDRVTGQTYLLDCSGVKPIGEASVFDRNTPPPGRRLDQTAGIPDRTALTDAYFDYLVGYRRADGQKLYLPFDPSKAVSGTPSVRSNEYQGVRVTQYQRVFPALDQATTTPPQGATSNDVTLDYEAARVAGQLADADIESSNYALAGGQTETQLSFDVYTVESPSGNIYYTNFLPAGAEPRYGNPWSILPQFTCKGGSYDGCTGCCRDTYGVLMVVPTSLTTASLACLLGIITAPLCLPGLIVGLGSIATLSGLLWDCTSWCDFKYYRVVK